MVDLVVVGAGVAGSVLAGSLSAFGRAIVLVEREARFRDRVRGEALHPWGAAEAARLGLVPLLERVGGRQLPVWQRYEGRRALEPYRWAEDVPDGHVEWGIPHPALQEALLADAAAKGARVLRPARAVGFERDGKATAVTVLSEGGGRREIVRARLVVGADGVRSPVRRWLGARTLVDPPHHAIAGALLRNVALDRGSAHQAYVPGGMVVAFPQGNAEVRAYVVCADDRAAAFRGPNAFSAFVAACAAAFPEGAFSGAEQAGPVGVFSCADVWADRIAGDGVVLVGDAAGANDPAQGHGLSLAFRDARVLRDLLLGTDDWKAAIDAFAEQRAAAFAVLRAHARWAGMLTVDEGPEADARRGRAARAREADPSLGGFAGIHAFGPDGLVADDAARRHFFGEDLDDGVRKTDEFGKAA